MAKFNIRLNNTTLLLVAAALYVVGCPPIGWWPFSFIGFSIFLRVLLVNSQSPGRTAFCFFMFPFGCYVFGFYWVAVAMQNLFDLGWLISIGFTIAFCAAYAGIASLGGIFWAIISKYISTVVYDQRLLRFFALFAFLMIWDTIVPKPANWSYQMVIGTSEWLLSSMSVVGSEGWWIVFLVASIALANLTIDKSKWRFAGETVLILAVVYSIGGTIGYLNTKHLQQQYTSVQPVSLIQDNVFITKRDVAAQTGSNTFFNQLLKTTAVHQQLVREIEDHYKNNSDQAAFTRAPVVIWPENSMLTDIINDRNARARAVWWARRTGGIHFVGGSERTTVQFGRNEFPARYNVIAQFSKDGYLNHYRKQIPIPWGEYIPGGKMFPQLYEYIPEFLISVPGDELTVLADPSPEGPVFVPVICYEILFSSHLRKFVAEAKKKYPDRSIVLIHLASDGWFGNTTNPYFQAFIARWQAASLGLPLLRVSNTGFSEVIAPWGKVLHSAPRNQSAVIFGEVPLLSTEKQRTQRNKS